MIKSPHTTYRYIKMKWFLLVAFTMLLTIKDAQLRRIIRLGLSDALAPPPPPSPNPEPQNKEYNLALEAIFTMGLRLQALIGDNSEENFLVSPISAALTIGQLLLGAGGTFQRQLYDLLSLPTAAPAPQPSSAPSQQEATNISPKNSNNPVGDTYSLLHYQLSRLVAQLGGNFHDFQLNQTSGLFHDRHIHLRNEFLSNLRIYYATDVFPMDFGQQPIQSQQFINDWVFRATNGLIKSILANPPYATTSAILVNAVYFKAEWETHFDDSLNREGVFRISPHRQVNVTYMYGYLNRILYTESETYHLICIPYKHHELGMYVLLPKENHPYTYNIKAFTKTLRINDISYNINTAKRKDVVLKIPKMFLSVRLNLLRQLQKYRAYKTQTNTRTEQTQITDPIEQLAHKVNAFENFTQFGTAEDVSLTNAAYDSPMQIDEIVQEIVFSVNEKGTEAAAATSVIIDYMGGSKTVLLTRPFVFFVRHEATLTTLFWGAITNPLG